MQTQSLKVEFELFADDAGNTKFRCSALRNDDGTAAETIEPVAEGADLSSCIAGWCVGFLASVSGLSFDKTLSDILEKRLN